MSARIAPSAGSLAEKIRATHANVVAELGVDPSPPPADENDLYEWAQRAFDKLQTETHLDQPSAKRRMANAMGITTDPAYRADVGTLLRSLWPRHRVAARFAREGRWRAIWSLNWDCILESALERVGLNVHPTPGNQLANPLPWMCWYSVWAPGDPYQPAGQPGTVFVCKPHGCARKIASGSSQFIVTRAELNALTANLAPVVANMTVGFANTRVVTVGWRAEEAYIPLNLDAMRLNGTLIPAGEDALSIVNRTWYPPDDSDTKHNRIATIFGSRRDACFFSVEKGTDPKTDDLFLWIQTRYALLQMRLFASASAAWAAQVAHLDPIVQHFEQPRAGHLLNQLFDDFLAVWVRFCFNNGSIVYLRHGAAIAQALVATHLRDEHIPWMYDHVERKDLLAIISMVIALWGRINAGGGNQWDFNEFPGALWDGLNGHLVLPLPAWNNIEEPIQLSALKPLLESWNWPKSGVISRLSILPLRSVPTEPHFADENLTMRSSVARLMKTARLANPANIDVVSIADV